MRRPSIAFEWQELDEGQELPPNMTSDQAPRASRAAEEQRLLLGGATLFLVAALLVTPRVMGQAQRELAQAHDELARAVEVETRPEREATVSASARQESAATHQSHERVISLETQVFQHNVAAVLVRAQVDPNGDGHPTIYRQMRFYRQTGQGWQPTEPAPFLWGQPQHLATRHFEFTYRSGDAQAVQAVAADLDARYENIRNHMGLPSIPERKIAIDVVMENPRPSGRSIRLSRPITVTSPALLRAPESLTDAAILRQSILLHLVDKAISEAVSTHRLPPHWYPLLTTVRIWQLWDLGGPQTAWRDPVLRRFYADIQQIDDEVVPILPGAYTELCPLYTVWAGETWLPLLCPEADEAGTLKQGNWKTSRFTDFVHIPSNRFMFTPMHKVYDGVYDGGAYTRDHYEWVVWVVLLDYIAETFGPDRIGKLWPILHEHKGWETLIPAVFGMSVEEFEADWQTYLAEPDDH
jgi:hypothetical protein